MTIKVTLFISHLKNNLIPFFNEATPKDSKKEIEIGESQNAFREIIFWTVRYSKSKFAAENV